MDKPMVIAQEIIQRSTTTMPNAWEITIKVGSITEAQWVLDTLSKGYKKQKKDFSIRQK